MANSNGKPLTLPQKVWDRHVVQSAPGEPDLLYIDLHLVHEVTSPQAFESLRINDRPVRRPDLTLATVDHNVPTLDRSLPNPDPLSAQQIEVLRDNCTHFGVPLWDIFDLRQGIVHIISPEHGLTQPGMTIVCGDSHTSTHGAFGALAFGIGTSEVEHVLATQCLVQARPKTMLVRFEGALPPGVTAKDLVLGAIGQIGVSGGQGYAVEYAGAAIEALSMEGRMTLCNMSIEWGAKAGLMGGEQGPLGTMAKQGSGAGTMRGMFAPGSQAVGGSAPMPQVPAPMSAPSSAMPVYGTGFGVGISPEAVTSMAPRVGPGIQTGMSTLNPNMAPGLPSLGAIRSTAGTMPSTLANAPAPSWWGGLKNMGATALQQAQDNPLATFSNLASLPYNMKLADATIAQKQAEADEINMTAEQLRQQKANMDALRSALTARYNAR